ncbi:MAG: aspartyl-phosphate phosphatase Spo0E family protein [Clostridia bacterium]|nr:aspartyl-phosphate phosphatase Spo0E family protein [Clostridia bacterium]
MKQSLYVLNKNIEGLRQELYSLMNKKDKSDQSIILISQELDKLLVEYHRLMKKR